MGGVTLEYQHSCWIVLQQSNYLFPSALIVNSAVLHLLRYARLRVAAVAGPGVAQKEATEVEIYVDQREMVLVCLVL
jgi:hypothetical protein